MKNYFFSLFWCLIFTTGYSQEIGSSDFYLIDSLDLSELNNTDRFVLDSSLTVYHTASNDTTKVNALWFICESLSHSVWSQYQFKHYALTKELLNKNEVENETWLKTHLSGSLNNIGYYHKTQGAFDSAVFYYNESLVINEEIDDKEALISIYLNKGSALSKLGKNDEVEDCYNKALNMAVSIQYDYGIEFSLVNLATFYQDQGKVDEALEYNFLALKIQEKTDNKKGMGYSLSNIGNIYQHQENYEKSLEYYFESLKVREEVGINNDLTQSLVNIGSVYEQMKNYDEALPYFQPGFRDSGKRRRPLRKSNHAKSFWLYIRPTRRK